MRCWIKNVIGMVLAGLTALTPFAAHAQAPLSTSFTYQGELASGGVPVTGEYDVRFSLFDAAAGGTQLGSTLCSDNLSVTNGRFTVSLDFGAAFNGQQRFLEIEVRPDGGLDCSDASGYTVLSPRQELTATPNAAFSLAASDAASLNGQPPSFYQNAANLNGTIPDVRLSNNIAKLNSNQTFTGLLNFTNPGNTFAGNGAGLTNLNGGSISAGTLARSSLNADVQSGVGTVVTDLSLTGSAATFAQPYFVAVSGSFAYVVAYNSNRLQVFDISNPSSPVLVGNALTASAPYSVTVSGSFAYVVNFSANTLQIFNVSNPAAPTLAGSVATGNQPTSVAVVGSFAYVAHYDSFFSTNTLRVYDISNPAAPTQVGSIATGGRAYSIAAAGSYVYFADNGQSLLRIYNVSNPASPTLAGLVSTWSLPTSIAVSGSFAYVVSSNTGGKFQIFDISNPTAPALVGQSGAGSIPWGISVSGSRAYIVNWDSATLQVFNVSNPAAPALEAQIATGNRPNAVATFGSFAYVVNSNSNSLQVFSAPSGIGFSQRLAGSSLNGVNGGGLTGVNAAQLGGQAASFYTNASNITTGTLANTRTSGTDLGTPSTLVLRDASGNFAAATITANLNGNAATATNATQLNGQAASFYTNASNITAGTLANAQTTGTNLNTPSTLVLRDASGNFAAGTISATLNGNAATATSASSATTATTATNATQLNGQPASFYTNASNIIAGTLANSQTTGTNLNTPSTLVLRDASGNFAAGTITANLNGNATTATTANTATTATTANTATTATTASNATQLNGQPATFYTNASNITSGTISPAVLPTQSWANSSLGLNTLNPTSYTTVPGTTQAFTTRQGAAIISWTTSAYSAASTGFSLRIKAVTNGVTTTGPVTNFYFNLGNVHTTLGGNALVTIPSSGTTTFSLEVLRTTGAGGYAIDTSDSFTATIINIGQ